MTLRIRDILSLATGALCSVSASIAAPLVTNTEILLASDGERNDNLGLQIECDSDLLLVSAYRDSINGQTSGSVFVFQRQPDQTWLEVSNITPEDPAPSTFFGTSLRYQDGFAYIGSPGAFGVDPGFVYVFRMDSPSSWTQIAKLEADDSQPHDGFWFDPSVSGDLLAIGAPGRQDSGFKSGAVYLFRRNPMGVWEQETKLLASDGGVEDEFGSSIVLRDDLCIVSAPARSDDSPDGHGAVYVFQQTAPGVWEETAKIEDPEGEPTDQFGGYISFDGCRLAVGAWKDAEPSSEEAGSVSVFRMMAPDDWTLEAKLVVPNPAVNERLGRKVVIQGDLLLAGAIGSNAASPTAGAVHVFKRQPTGDWALDATLISSVATLIDNLGDDIALHDGQIFAGSPGNDINGSGAGAVFVFDADQFLCPPDLNNDSSIDTADLGILLSAFGAPSCGCCGAEINGDGAVDTADLGLLIAAFGSACP